RAAALGDGPRLRRVGRVHAPRDPHGSARMGHLGAQGVEALVEGGDTLDPQRTGSVLANRDDALHGLVPAAEAEGDHLADGEARIGSDLERRGEAVDGEAARLRVGEAEAGGPDEGRENQAPPPPEATPSRPPDKHARGGQLPNETRGGCRSSGRSGSKYARLANRKKDATVFEGKRSMAVLRSRTTAL